MLISNLFEFGGLTDAHLIAGKRGMYRPVTSVSVLEVAETQIKNWVLPHQLYITSFYAILNHPRTQLEVIKALNEAQSAGLVICHSEIFLKEVDSSIIEYCDSIDFPLIMANSATSYIEILNPILLALAKEQSETDETIHDRLLGMIASHGDPVTVYGLMCESYEKFLVFLDINDSLIFPKFDRKKASKTALLLGILSKCQIDSRQEPVTLEHHNKKFLFYPIQNQGLKYGGILAEVQPQGIEATIDQLRKFAIISILISTKNARIKELKIQQKQEFINDLITWNFRSTEIAITSGEQVGWKLKGKHSLLIVNLNEYVDYIQNNARDYEKLVAEVLYRKIQAIVNEENHTNLLGRRSDFFIVLLETSDEERIMDMADQIITVCKETLRGSVSIGFSDRFEEITDIPAAYKKAYTACMSGRRMIGTNQVAGYNRLGVYSFLEEKCVEEVVKKRCELLFARLIEYDQDNQSELLNTLCELALNDKDIDKTAQKLFVHRNTIIYRKNRAIEILGYNPLQMPDYLNTIILAYYRKNLSL